MSKVDMTTTTTTYSPCPHHTGWYFTVKFWVFEKQMYWCELCLNAIRRKDLPDFLKKS